MSEGGEKKKPGLRVDRLAEAMEAARARARGETRRPARAAGAQVLPRAVGPDEPSRPEAPPEPERSPPEPTTPTPKETPPTPKETPPEPRETPPPSPEETPTGPEESPPAPEETPPSTPDERPPSAPDEVPPSTPDEVPPSAPDEVPPQTPEEIVPPPGNQPGGAPTETPPRAPEEIPPAPGEIPGRPDETPPSAPDELPPQTPDELPDDWPQDRSAATPDGTAAPHGWGAMPTTNAQLVAARGAPDSAPLPPLLLETPLAPATVPAACRDTLSAPTERRNTPAATPGGRSAPAGRGEEPLTPTRHGDTPAAAHDKPDRADRISEKIRQETEGRDAPPAVPPEVMPPRRDASRTRSALGPPLLTLSGVATDIGRYHILSDVGFEVPTGGVTMLLGRNGAGKTTTLRTIMGLWRAKAGRIALAEEDIAAWAPPRIARSGIGYVPEDMGIFGDLTVAENLTLAARSGPLRADRLDWIFATFPPLRTFLRSPAGVLSGGQKQMLAMARAMAEQRRLYLIDEPTKGLAPAIVATLVGALRDLKAQGTSILLVEQNFAVARALGDTAVVMENGGVAWTGAMADLADDAALQERLMGLSMEGAA